MKTTERAQIIADMQSMFVTARKQGLWFYSHYQALWFSPDELEAMHAQERFIWGPDNWVLRDPAHHLKELHDGIMAAANHLKTFQERMSGP